MPRGLAKSPGGACLLSVPDLDAASDSSPSPPPPPQPELTLRPIGYIRTSKRLKFQAGHQPDESQMEENWLELLPGENFEQALVDLAGFERVWLIWWFHRNPNWRPQVIPPRGPQRRRGVFATRSPHRPNALGMTPVRLLSITGRVLRLGPCDLMEGTPVFDLKPYVPGYDCFPDARAGWIDEVDALEAAPLPFTVELAPLAREQADWLFTKWEVDFLPRVLALLARDPSPHRTRRIRKTDTGFEIGCGAWRAVFCLIIGSPAQTVETKGRVCILGLGPAYPRKFLERDGYAAVPDRAAQLAFLDHWPDSELPLKRQ